MPSYAGIGSRQTPEHIIKLMEGIGARMPSTLVLRSGGAKGADQAFERGCDKVNGPKEIFRAEDCTEAAMEYTAKFHPNWKACRPYTRRLHGRNAMIVLGRDLDDPVRFVLCWTNGGKLIGGTAQALRIAQAHNIPIINFGEEHA